MAGVKFGGHLDNGNYKLEFLEPGWWQRRFIPLVLDLFDPPV